MSNYYKTLGVEREATPDEVKRAYRKLAHQYHPDKKGGSEVKFKEINEAYQILSDPQKRAHYDRFGKIPGGGPTGGSGRGFDGFDFSQFGGFNREFDFDIEDIFGMFGGGFGQRGPRQARTQASRGQDLEIGITIDFREMARGGVKRVNLKRDIICQKCGGSGAQADGGLVDCTVCNGKGEVKETMGSFFGSFTRIYACNVCRGSGKVPKTNCPVCLGEGKVRGDKTLDIAVPAGIKDGETLVVRGQGQAGFRGVPAGDLYVKVRVTPDRQFARQDNDLVYILPVKLTDAVLGARIRMPTLDGDKEIEIPAGLQDGQELLLKGYGIHGHRKGDQIIRVKIEIPKKLSPKARKLVEELAAEL